MSAVELLVASDYPDPRCLRGSSLQSAWRSRCSCLTCEGDPQRKGEPRTETSLTAPASRIPAAAAIRRPVIRTRRPIRTTRAIAASIREGFPAGRQRWRGAPGAYAAAADSAVSQTPRGLCTSPGRGLIHRTSRPPASRVNSNASTPPPTMPSHGHPQPAAETIASTERRSAPSAIRMPISFAR